MAASCVSEVVVASFCGREFYVFRSYSKGGVDKRHKGTLSLFNTYRDEACAMYKTYLKIDPSSLFTGLPVRDREFVPNYAFCKLMVTIWDSFLVQKKLKNHKIAPHKNGKYEV